MAKPTHAWVHDVQQHPVPMRGTRAMSLVSNHHFPRHSHDEFGIGVIAAGAQRSWSGMGLVEAGPGDVIMVNPGEMHDGLPLGDKPRRWRMLYFDAGRVAEELAQEGIQRLDLLRPVARDPLLARQFLRLFTRLTSDGAGPLAREAHLLRLLMRMFQRHGTARPSGAPMSAVAKALQRLNAAPEEPVSLAELAALSGVSRFQLLRGFAREVGITPHAYLVQRRVLTAQQLLAAGRRPVEVAAQAGFADQAHMTRAFVRQLGITPARFRAVFT